MENEVKQIGIIDCTPTWESLVDVLIDGIANSNYIGRSEFRKELIKMARAADQYNAIIKSINQFDL